MADEESFFDGEMTGFMLVEDELTQEKIREARIQFENGSSIEYQSEQPKIEEEPSDRNILEQLEGLELARQICQYRDLEIPLEIGGYVEIERHYPYSEFKENER